MSLSNRKLWYLAVGLAVGIGAGYLAAGGTGTDVGGSGGGDAGSPTAAPTGSDRPSRGPEDAPVTIVEFTDYECPFCRRYYRQTYRRLLEAYEGEIRYVVRNFPLSIHPRAREAAEAAECAHNQGRFWDYHDHLFENADALEAGDLKRYARELGLDGDRFDRCLDSGEESGTVESDLATGRRLGIRGTPTFFVNGRPLVGAQPLSAFHAAIDRVRSD